MRKCHLGVHSLAEVNVQFTDHSGYFFFKSSSILASHNECWDTLNNLDNGSMCTCYFGQLSDLMSEHNSVQVTGQVHVIVLLLRI